MRGLKNKTAIVTGAGSGIGKAIALRLASEGIRVGVFDIRGEAAAETATAIETAGGIAVPITCDITDYAAVVTSVATFETAIGGGTDILVNNAGWDTPMPFLKTDEAFWKKVVSINYFGPLHMTHAVGQGMSARKSGRIINIASDAGRVGSSGEVVYSGCKGATIAFGKALAREVARNNITINTICPGRIATGRLATVFGNGTPGQLEQEQMAQITKLIPMGRVGEPNEIAGLVAFLCSPWGAYMTGTVQHVDGGRLGSLL